MLEKVWDYVEDENTIINVYFLKDKKKRLIKASEMILSITSTSADIYVADKLLSFRKSDTNIIKEDVNYLEFSIFDKYGCVLTKL